MTFCFLKGQVSSFNFPSSSERYPHFIIYGKSNDISFKAAINTYSRDNSVVEYYLLKENYTGLEDQILLNRDINLSYKKDYHLIEEDFKKVESIELDQIIKNLIETEIIIYGFTFPFGTDSNSIGIQNNFNEIKIMNSVGIHDIHCNSGEPENSKWKNQENKDGLVGFVKEDEITWLFIKFQTQIL